jgi:hypothetical protein
MEIDKRIEKLLTLNGKHGLLSNWETHFLVDIKNKPPGYSLSVRQNSLLQKIEAKLSPATLEETRNWKQNWTKEKARTLHLIAEYYRGTGYFTSLSRQVLHDPAYIPPRKAYEKMCENKYAQRVLEVAAEPPAFPEGTTVMLRATAKSKLSNTRFNKLKNYPLFVLRVLPHVHSSAKGAKLYEILSGCSCDVFRIEERFLKSYRKPKAKQAV